MPAAVSKIKSENAAGMAGEHKAVARPPHSERVLGKAAELLQRCVSGSGP